MSPRIKVLRKVLNLPVVKGFKPYGPELNKQNAEPVNLLYEEYEALRLCDYDMSNHQQASVMMGVSRPTFTRIYASALQKIAKAFVEGRQISIEGGKVYFDSDWYTCKKCLCFFNNPEKEKSIEKCPLCGSKHINKYDYENGQDDITDKLCNDLCVCPSCGFELEHKNGIPCNQETCPECSTIMIRKGNLNCRNLKTI